MPEAKPADEAGRHDARAEPWTFEDMLAAAAMAVLVLITAANVVTRYVIDVSFAWTEEVSVIVMVLMVFAGAGAAALRYRHIRMDLLAQRGSAGWQGVAHRIGRVATAVTFGLLAVLLVRAGIDEFRYDELNTLNFPRWWITAPESLLALVIALRALGLGAGAGAAEPAEAGSAAAEKPA